MTKMKNEVLFTDILGDKLFDCDYFLYYDMNRYGNPTIRYGQVDEVEDKYKFRMSDFLLDMDMDYLWLNIQLFLRGY